MEDKKYKVYCHKNKVNGFEYVGMTCRDVKERWSGKALSYANCKNFEDALEKYGWDGFEHIVLVSGLTKEKAKSKETELIRKNNAAGISYNIREDDDFLGNLRRRPVDVYDIDGNLLETCESIHDVCVKYKSGETYTYYCVLGRKKTLRRKYVLAFHGDDISEKLAEAKIDRRYKTPAHNRRNVKMLSLDGEYIHAFDSVTDAANFVGVSLGSIVLCCKGENKTCKGYKWSYV